MYEGIRLLYEEVPTEKLSREAGEKPVPMIVMVCLLGRGFPAKFGKTEEIVGVIGGGATGVVTCSFQNMLRFHPIPFDVAFRSFTKFDNSAGMGPPAAAPTVSA